MADEIYVRFEKLKEEKDVTSYAVAKATGITTTTLTNWGKGKYTPKQDKLQLIADYFGVTLDYLVNGEEKEKADYSDVNAKLTDLLRHDAELVKALQIYAKLPPTQKNAIINMINSYKVEE